MMPFPKDKVHKLTKEENSRGGSRSTPAKSKAKKIYWKIKRLKKELKKRGGKFSKEAEQKMVDFFTDPDLAATDIYSILMTTLNYADKKNTKGMVSVISKMIDLHKQVHGTKIKMDSRNRNENIMIHLDGGDFDFGKDDTAE